MDGPSVIRDTTIGQFPGYWHIVDSGDYNGDGNADLLWRAGGTVTLWEMDGPTVLADSNVATIPTYWQIQ